MRESQFADALAYEQCMGRWSRRLAPLLLEFAGIPDGWHILDVGSGTGSLALEIAARRPHCRIIGIDPSEEYVAYASAVARNPLVSFAVGHAQALSFADDEFDASLSLLSFSFICDPRSALDQLRRVVRPGGQICAATWDYGDGMEMLRIFWDTAVELDLGAVQFDERSTLLGGRDALRTLWREAELVDTEERPLEIAMQFGSFDDFWEPFLLGQGPSGAYIKRTSPELRIALRDEVARRLPRTMQAAFELRGRAWAVRGTVGSHEFETPDCPNLVITNA